MAGQLVCRQLHPRALPVPFLDKDIRLKPEVGDALGHLLRHASGLHEEFACLRTPDRDVVYSSASLGMVRGARPVSIRPEP